MEHASRLLVWPRTVPARVHEALQRHRHVTKARYTDLDVYWMCTARRRSNEEREARRPSIIVHLPVSGTLQSEEDVYGGPPTFDSDGCRTGLLMRSLIPDGRCARPLPGQGCSIQASLKETGEESTKKCLSDSRFAPHPPACLDTSCSSSLQYACLLPMIVNVCSREIQPSLSRVRRTRAAAPRTPGPGRSLAKDCFG